MAAEAAGLARKRDKILSAIVRVSSKARYHSVPKEVPSDDISHV